MLYLHKFKVACISYEWNINFSSKLYAEMCFPGNFIADLTTYLLIIAITMQMAFQPLLYEWKPSYFNSKVTRVGITKSSVN